MPYATVNATVEERANLVEMTTPKSTSLEIAPPSVVVKPNGEKHYYRKEIDGLRAVAVLSVICNHIDKHSLPCGF